MSLFVVNKGDKTHADRFNGQDYVFPPGEVVEIPPDAAQHIFGFGLDDQEKLSILTRLGIYNSADKPRGLALLDQFVFQESVPEVPTAADMGVQAPAPKVAFVPPPEL